MASVMTGHGHAVDLAPATTGCIEFSLGYDNARQISPRGGGGGAGGGGEGDGRRKLAMVSLGLVVTAADPLCSFLSFVVAS
ncbi:hypothetical protein E2562_027603 [Oryza meyeriana var. granulata]|uniref:Uncharacterized protein n=1 Tax=Oryza meyeriana var. granulata TaxID=110450 RepID=A0A6G1DNV7_9ORYZ|nr:hypothetical protein E2562_027603 [Oryza meyeriana var. granulata]